MQTPAPTNTDQIGAPIFYQHPLLATSLFGGSEWNANHQFDEWGDNRVQGYEVAFGGEQFGNLIQIVLPSGVYRYINGRSSSLTGSRTRDIRASFLGQMAYIRNS